MIDMIDCTKVELIDPVKYEDYIYIHDFITGSARQIWPLADVWPCDDLFTIGSDTADWCEVDQENIWIDGNPQPGDTYWVVALGRTNITFNLPEDVDYIELSEELLRGLVFRDAFGKLKPPQATWAPSGFRGIIRDGDQWSYSEGSGAKVYVNHDATMPWSHNWHGAISAKGWIHYKTEEP